MAEINVSAAINNYSKPSRDGEAGRLLYFKVEDNVLEATHPYTFPRIISADVTQGSADALDDIIRAIGNGNLPRFEGTYTYILPNMVGRTVTRMMKIVGSNKQRVIGESAQRIVEGTVNVPDGASYTLFYKTYKGKHEFSLTKA